MIKVSPVVYIAALSLYSITFVLLTIFCLIWCILATYFAIKKRKELISLNCIECPYNGVLMAQLEFRKYNTQIESTKLRLIAIICAIETISNFAIVCTTCGYIYNFIIDMVKAAHPLLANTTSSNINNFSNLYDSHFVFVPFSESLYLVCFPMVSLLMYYLKQSYLAKQPQTSFLCKWIAFLFCVSILFLVLLLIKEIQVIVKPLFAVAVLISVISYFIQSIELYKVLKKRHKESILFDSQNKAKHKQTKIIYKRFFSLALAFGILASILWLFVVTSVIGNTISILYNVRDGKIVTIFTVLELLLLTSFGIGFDLMSLAGVASVLCSMAITTYKRRKRTYRYFVGSIDAYERMARVRLIENGQVI